MEPILITIGGVLIVLLILKLVLNNKKSEEYDNHIDTKPYPKPTKPYPKPTKPYPKPNDDGFNNGAIGPKPDDPNQK